MDGAPADFTRHRVPAVSSRSILARNMVLWDVTRSGKKLFDIQERRWAAIPTSVEWLQRGLNRVLNTTSGFWRGIVVVGCLFAMQQAVDADDAAFFETRIRPLLIKHCLECHGVKKQESGLRLDSRAGWMRGGDSGPAIIPGEPDSSLVIKAVRHSDPDRRMPADRQKLTPRQIADLARWIDQGAFDPRRQPTDNGASDPKMSLEAARSFWAFQPLPSPSPPRVKRQGWTRTAIDAFILTELERRGLVPVPEADRRTLIRRATFDLTGLPPTPAEINAFLSDRSPDAYDVLLDRLLSSPEYGERWGRHWLDVARYADTAGDGADYPVREAVKYRDWVIRAFNADKPFDAFVREQIAGDILAVGSSPAEYADRVTATGFLAIGKRYGYKPSPDYQHLDFADVIDSVGRSLLGLSLGCARCHDHKYDPVSAADYYALYGILQSTQWSFPGGEEHKRPAHLAPLVPPPEAARLEKTKQDALAELNARLPRLMHERSQLGGQWFAGGVDLDLEAQATGKPPGKPWVSAGPIEVTAAAQSPFAHVHPAGTRGVRLGSGKPTDGLRYVFEDGLRTTPGKQMHFTLDFRTVATSTQKGAYRFYLGRGVVQSLAVECSATATEFAIRNASKWETIRALQPGTWYTLRLTLDPHTKTYSGVVGTPDDLTRFADKGLGPNWDGVADTFICDAFGHVAGSACARDVDNIGLQETPFAAPGSEPVVRREPTAEDKRRLAELETEIQALKDRQTTLSSAAVYEVAYAVSEGQPVNARIHTRGDPAQPAAEVPRRFLEVLGGDTLGPGSSGSGRLELAEWITRRSNPLTARVFVNRVWGWHFGQGLVGTPSDFGARGERPTHPELLDWLASDFIASGWSIKSLHRQIMRSRTYRLASHDVATNLKSDPGNRWHWRYARQPLEAEAIRDAMLAVSGQLDRTLPTAHPFPDVNSWGFTIHNPFHAVYDSQRRSVYLMVQRNRRHPFLALFDAADPNQSVAKRQPTTTPTQALFLMNSPFVHAQSRAFAQRLLSAPGDMQDRIQLAFETTLGHPPEPQRVAEITAFLTAYQQTLERQAIPVAQRPVEVWAALARVLLTSNAFLYVD